MAGETPAETARRFLEGDLHERIDLSAGPLQRITRLRLRLHDGSSPPQPPTIIRSLEVAHEDATSAVVVVDGEIEGRGSVSGPVTLERRNGEWRVLDYSPFGMRALERILGVAPTDVRAGARATLTLLYLGGTGPEAEARIENTSGAALAVREVWFGRGRRWARGFLRGPADVAPGGEATYAFSRLCRPPDRIVIVTGRDPFVFDLGGEGRHDVPPGLRWARSRWRYAPSFLLVLPFWVWLGARAALIVLVGFGGLLALQHRQERTAFGGDGSPTK